MTTIHRVDTPLGPVTLVVAAEPGIGEAGVEVAAREVAVDLPAGLRCDHVGRLVVLVPAGDRPVTATFAVAGTGTGDPEPGERLACLRFHRDRTSLALACREDPIVPGSDIPFTAAIDVGATGLVVAIGGRRDRAVAIDFALAFASGVDPDDLSTWFAVDRALP